MAKRYKFSVRFLLAVESAAIPFILLVHAKSSMPRYVIVERFIATIDLISLMAWIVAQIQIMGLTNDFDCSWAKWLHASLATCVVSKVIDFITY